MFLKIVLGNFLWYRGLDDAAVYGALPMCLALYTNHLIMVVPSPCPFYSCGNWGWEKHRRLSKATSLADVEMALGPGQSYSRADALNSLKCTYQHIFSLINLLLVHRHLGRPGPPKTPIPKRTMADDYTQLLPASERPSLSMRLPSRTTWGLTIHEV